MHTVDKIQKHKQVTKAKQGNKYKAISVNKT